MQQTIDRLGRQVLILTFTVFICILFVFILFRILARFFFLAFFVFSFTIIFRFASLHAFIIALMGFHMSIQGPLASIDFAANFTSAVISPTKLRLIIALFFFRKIVESSPFNTRGSIIWIIAGSSCPP